MQTWLLEPGHPAWLETLKVLRHDFYQLPSFVEFASRRHDQGAPGAFLAVEGANRLLVPLIVRTIPDELVDAKARVTDAVSPRGYPGPIFGLEPGSLDDDTAARLVRAFISTMRDSGIVSAFIRLHPLLPPPYDALRTAGQLVDVGDSVSIDLTLSLEALWHQTRQGHRRSINRAHRAGYRVRIDERWERFDDFVEVYAESMARREAVPFWRLSPDYFRDLRTALAERLHLCVVEIGDTVAAAALVTETDGIVEYHSSGTSDAHVQASPTKLLIDFVRAWAKARGNRVLNLTGSTRKGDSLIHFKLGFSPLLHTMYAWRVVADEEAYRRLTERRLGRPVEGGDLETEGFFPAYRRPPQAVVAS